MKALVAALIRDDSLETTTGLSAPKPNDAVRKISNSEPKWVNANRYVKSAISYTLSVTNTWFQQQP